MTFYERITEHLNNNGSIAIKSYTKPVFIFQVARVKKAENDKGIYVSVDKQGVKWNYVMPMHIAFYHRNAA